MATNTGIGTAYIYTTFAYAPIASGVGTAYSFETTTYSPTHSGVGCAYSYDNIMIYVISNSNMLPPIIT